MLSTDKPVECPLQCGQCCDYWKDVDVLRHRYSTAVDCPFLGKDGCTKPRDQRPLPCLEYICEVGQAVIDGVITHNEGVSYKEQGEEFLPPL